ICLGQQLFNSFYSQFLRPKSDLFMPAFPHLLSSVFLPKPTSVSSIFSSFFEQKPILIRCHDAPTDSAGGCPL
ncbi:unnamed protein product, partial [Ilex paraguariensis]